MKNRLICVGLCVAFASISGTVVAAPVTLTLDNPFQYAKAGVETPLNFSGKIVVEDGYTPSTATLELPGLFLDPSYIYLYNVAFSPAFTIYNNGHVDGADFEGLFFTLTVPTGAAKGNYFFNPSRMGDDPTRSELVFYYKDANGNQYHTTEKLGVTVNETGQPSVPGPAAALPMVFGMAVLALKRRRSR